MGILQLGKNLFYEKQDGSGTELSARAKQRRAIVFALAAIGLTALAFTGGVYGLNHLVTIGAIAHTTGVGIGIPMLGATGASGLYLVSRFKKWKETGEMKKLDKAIFAALGFLGAGVAFPLSSLSVGAAAAGTSVITAIGKLSIFQAGLIAVPTLSIPGALGLGFIVSPALNWIGGKLPDLDSVKDLFSSSDEGDLSPSLPKPGKDNKEVKQKRSNEPKNRRKKLDVKENDNEPKDLTEKDLPNNKPKIKNKQVIVSESDSEE